MQTRHPAGFRGARRLLTRHIGRVRAGAGGLLLALVFSAGLAACMQPYAAGNGPQAKAAVQDACYRQLRQHLEDRKLTAATRGDFQLAMQLCSVRQVAAAKLLLDKQNTQRQTRPDGYSRECVPTWNCRCANHRYEELFARRNMKNHRMAECSLTPKFPVFDGSGAAQFSYRRS